MADLQMLWLPPNQIGQAVDDREKLFKFGQKWFKKQECMEDENGLNNYNKFRQKSKPELNPAKYWKYIGGPEYDPPQIPELQVTQHIEGLNPSGVMITFTIPGHEVKVEAAKQKAKDWLDGNKKTKAIIARAVLLSKLYHI
ncbi:hypothetical protein BT96DRAFT_1004115 [Gymnopus androsaceus JB14]|uniref:Uncharacterized protein n=1 Tax=Gymnopus androsaceus JB14 TaxID=1447944 RepID=A0A6A4GTL1_9AGAR|nr:hypothetical protein BT96DRAFT_1004115 [Gymnopus androsaceus JB14]